LVYGFMVTMFYSFHRIILSERNPCHEDQKRTQRHGPQQGELE